MTRKRRMLRLISFISVTGLLPAFILQCDKAALNLQRGLLTGLGLSVADTVVDTFVVLDTGTAE